MIEAWVSYNFVKLLEWPWGCNSSFIYRKKMYFYCVQASVILEFLQLSAKPNSNR